MVAHKAPEHAVSAVADPGVIIRIQASLADQGEMIQLEGFIDRDATQDEYHALCDKMMAAADRKKAQRLLPIYQRNLEDEEHKLTENKARVAELNARLKALDEARAEKDLELQARLQDVVSRARDEHAASGRRAEFKPGRALTGTIEAQLSQLRENGIKEHAEAEVQRQTLKGEIEAGERVVFKWKQLIAEQRALV